MVFIFDVLKFDVWHLWPFLSDIWQRSAFYCSTWLISAFFCSTFDNVRPFLSERVVVTVVLVVSSSRVWRQIWHWSRAINVKKVSSTKKKFAWEFHSSEKNLLSVLLQGIKTSSWIMHDYYEDRLHWHLTYFTEST
jgi:thiol:disulfide interchange protein